MRAYAYQNRRRSHRIYLRTRITCIEPRGAPHEAGLGNIGKDGLFIHAPAPYPAGTRLTLEFQLAGSRGRQEIRAKGEVAWVRRQGDDILPGFGIRFTDLAEADAEEIRRLIDRRREVSVALLKA